MVHIYSAGLLLPMMATSSVDTIFKPSNGFKVLNVILLDPYVKALVQTSKPFTFFAPTDKAFELMNESALTELLSDSSALVALTKKHMAVDIIYTSFLDNRSNLVTILLSGETLTLSKSNGDKTVRINDLAVVTSPYDVTTGNGVVHAVDSLL